MIEYKLEKCPNCNARDCFKVSELKESDNKLYYEFTCIWCEANGRDYFELKYLYTELDEDYYWGV